MFPQELLRAFQMRQHHLAPETKGRDKQDIITILRDAGGLSWTAPLYHRMAIWKREWLTELQWQDKKVVEGRFFGGSLQYIPVDELPLYYQALTPKLELTPVDRLILDLIEAHGPVTKGEITNNVNLSKKAVKEALHRLDLSLKIVRAGWAETRGWGQPIWETFEKWAPKGLDLKAIAPERAKEEIILKFLRTNGVLSLRQLGSLFKGSFKPNELRGSLAGLEKRGLVVSGAFIEDLVDEQYTTPDGLSSLGSESGEFTEEFICILGQGDPFCRIWRDELFALFGLREPSARGPAWLSYVFLSETPVGVVDYKWRVEWSQINNIRLLPDCYDEDSLGMILKGLEQEAKLMGHKGVEIRNINDSPARFHLEISLGEMLCEEGYSPKGEWFVKRLGVDPDD
jgi:hypothetical protein